MRRFAALVRGLPPDSALARSIDPHILGRGWKAEHELLAAVIEVIGVSNHLFMQANSKRGAKLPPPLRVPRPTDAARTQDKAERTAALKAKMAERGIPIARRRRKRQKD